MSIEELAKKADALSKRFDALDKRKEMNERYWSYRAPRPPTVGELPAGAFKGTQEQFSQLSPGMRREIQRQAERANAKK